MKFIFAVLFSVLFLFDVPALAAQTITSRYTRNVGSSGGVGTLPIYIRRNAKTLVLVNGFCYFATQSRNDYACYTGPSTSQTALESKTFRVTGATTGAMTRGDGSSNNDTLGGTIVSGQNGLSIVGGVLFFNNFVLEPGSNFYFNISGSGGTSDVGIDLKFVEYP